MTAFPSMEVARWEYRRHTAARRQPLADGQAIAPRPWQAVEADVATLRLLDQILYRFAELQDAAGERLVPATLAHLAEAAENPPMRDRPDRPERLGYLDALPCLDWRAARNRPVHEHPDAPGLRWAALGDALQAHDRRRRAMDCVEAWQARLGLADQSDRKRSGKLTCDG